jgi:uncharacterized protein YdhG (YjbR/CyaY superfamily)
MKIEAENPDDYVSKVQDVHKEAMVKLRKTIKENLPKGFEEQMSYGMLGYVVPHSIYPDGYHCNTSLPLPFMNLASQKNFIGLYHMGIYADSKLYDWWVEEYGKRVPSKLDMGKSCVRLKKVDQIPYDLVAELCQKMTVADWVELYEGAVKR